MAMHMFRDWMNNMDAMMPSHLLDQHFGLGLNPDDLVRPALQMPRNYLRPWRVGSQDTGSVVKCDKERFQVNLDVQQFSPDEVQVKVVDNSIVVEGKHEEKQDEHGYISRQFVRRYVVPQDYKLDAVASHLSSDGVLTVSAPRAAAIEGQEGKVIPITHTGPSKAIKHSENTHAWRPLHEQSARAMATGTAFMVKARVKEIYHLLKSTYE